MVICGGHVTMETVTLSCGEDVDARVTGLAAKWSKITTTDSIWTEQLSQMYFHMFVTRNHSSTEFMFTPRLSHLERLPSTSTIPPPPS